MRESAINRVISDKKKEWVKQEVTIWNNIIEMREENDDNRYNIDKEE